MSRLGLVFAKLFPAKKSTLKTDVIHFLEGCDLSTEDIKVEYNRDYNPIAMYARFADFFHLFNIRHLYKNVHLQITLVKEKSFHAYI